ncbi:MAG: response regulator [Bacteroidetes bacterium]|nr:response regulator [Bacteroidota bacterium]
MFLNIGDLYDLKFKQPENPLAYILLVEDHELGIKIRSCRLAKMGFNVDIATNGEEAVSKVKENPNKYDVILMNYIMPMMNGIQATRIIRKQLGFKKIIIGYSAGYFGDPFYYDAGKKAGMTNCVDAEEMVVINELVRWLYIEPEKRKQREKERQIQKSKSWFQRLKEMFV